MNYLILFAVGIVAILILRYLINKKLKESKQKKLTSRYGQEFGTLIANRRIAIGMSLEMVKAAWGQPLKTDGKVIRENYLKQNYYFEAYKDKTNNTHYQYRVTIENDKVIELREN